MKAAFSRRAAFRYGRQEVVCVVCAPQDGSIRSWFWGLISTDTPACGPPSVIASRIASSMARNFMATPAIVAQVSGSKRFAKLAWPTPQLVGASV